MPPKKQRMKIKGAKDEGKQTQTETKGVSIQCHFITPGPAYKLKTLVGYKDHCISRYRNPAHTFGRRRKDVFGIAEGPGPKYMVKEPKRVGFTFGIPTKHHDLDTGPGPKYNLPDVPRGPFFSIKWRTKVRKIHETPGPYYVKPIADAPAFFMGLRTAGSKPPDTPGPYTFEVNAIKPKVPMYTMTAKRTLRVTSASPGPIYALPLIKPTPAFSFGVKHSVCAPPYIVECDDQC
ncbi:outer dense fiber protein 3B-like [Pseudomyrmex gracilis]|uniref:outer dense fiber protein 3B-like n=1 Tax=Pseudomyrmex gracilis TaxID=219809 RepID=UPI000994A074|nr:outer dense fiber protein 3B-like [Pseudomyrmex gracilis]